MYNGANLSDSRQIQSGFAARSGMKMRELGECGGRHAKSKTKKSPLRERAESIFLEENRGDKCIMLRRGISIQLIVGMIEIRQTDN
ncbi:hypothetical protein O0881_05650 [Janthinobacterium sp. SUN100]|uniref:hypothetical protein n=1 Tax=Janthinobacterium sp. SUN100 TaxID=3004101 RepID=UPI0025AFA467|nr:hypothetical protein [Janthinobacterium sp. SUN100]MDN2701482.1 hypothetical protein [Janthinobacterium sp. SUN100]